jgi:hypothetical protein
MVQALPGSTAPRDAQLAPEPVEANVSESSCQHAPGHVDAPNARTVVAPIARERFLLQVSIGQSTRDNLRYAQELLSHEIPSGEIAEVLDRALKLLVARLEKRKFAAACKPRQTQRATTSRRHVPAQVKRAVWERDGGQCTFVSEGGRRCLARELLEYDHIDPVARGGHATVTNMRLRCRAHNPYAAECVFGAGFMEQRRQEAQEAAERRDRAQEVIPYLRRLGFSADDSRRAAKRCDDMMGASLEERVRRALSSFQPRGRVMAPATRATMAVP